MPIKKNSVGHPSTSNYQPQKDKSYRFITIAVLGFFIGLILCVSLYSRTLITILQLSKFFIGFTVIGFLIPLKYYQKWFHFIKYETIIFNIIGVAPSLTGLFLLFNFCFNYSSTPQEYTITDIDIQGEGNYRSIQLVLENNLFANEPKIVKVDELDFPKLPNHKKLKLDLAKGAFGFQVIKEKKLMN